MGDKSLILNQIKNHLGIESEAAFARFLGITPQTLNNWHKRDTFDLATVYTKCLCLEPHWLITGEGEMIKKRDENGFTPGLTLDKDSQEAGSNEHTPGHKSEKLSPKQGEKLSPALSPTPENCPICDQKERIIAAQEDTIESQRVAIQALKRLCQEHYQDSAKKTG
jgi:hypothetical protein